MNKTTYQDLNNDELIGRHIRGEAMNIKPDRLLLRQTLDRATIGGLSSRSLVAQPSFTKTARQTVLGWVSVWKISLPAAAVILIIALGAWQGRASLLMLSEDFSGHSVGTENNASGRSSAQTGVPAQTISSGDSNADLNQDISVINSKLSNINSDSSALDQSLNNSGNKNLN